MIAEPNLNPLTACYHEIKMFYFQFGTFFSDASKMQGIYELRFAQL